MSVKEICGEREIEEWVGKEGGEGDGRSDEEEWTVEGSE